jgi:hypothetical protein
MLEVVILVVTVDNKTRLKAYKLASVIKLVLIYLLSKESIVANRNNSNNNLRAVLLVGKVLSALSAKLLC